MSAMAAWLQAKGLQVWAHQQLFTCVCLKLGGKKRRKKERTRENEHFNFPIKSMPQYESLFAFLY